METVAFLSYAHLDDSSASTEVAMIHELLESELRVHTGHPVHIFFDRKAIGWGKRWKEIIGSSIQNATFFIPVLTPAFFQSQSCRKEYQDFLKAEELAGRNDLILPLYYVTCREINVVGSGQPLIDDILGRQYRDWRKLRHQPRQSPELLQQFAKLAATMAETYFQMEDAARASSDNKNQDAIEKKAALSEYKSVLDRDVEYDSLVLYSVAEFPGLPTSPEWARALLRDINLQRYRRIRDIDREVKYAKSVVDAYAAEQPRLFKFSTDYISKSLIFVDSEFRTTHSIAPETKQAAEIANITRY